MTRHNDVQDISEQSGGGGGDQHSDQLNGNIAGPGWPGEAGPAASQDIKHNKVQKLLLQMHFFFLHSFAKRQI